MAEPQALGPSDFGPFESAFAKLPNESVPGYLALLHLQREPASAVMRTRITEALSCSNDPVKDVSLLFSDVNWRPHLVGCLALIVMDDVPHRLLDACWSAADAGSWVTPQIMATLRIVDPGYKVNAEKRIANCFSVFAPEDISPIERHSATGPAGTTGRMSKYAASCIALLYPEKSIEQNLAEIGSTEDVSSLVRDDIDNSANVAVRWYTQAWDCFGA